jgi:urease accessory protein
MSRARKKVSLLTSAATNGNARPHPTPERDCAESQSQQLSHCCGWSATQPRSDAESTTLIAPDFLIWQLCDSAFPTGGFAHSSGLEAAWQHGEVRGRAELLSFTETSLEQLGHAALPFVTAAFDAPEKLSQFDALCDVFTTNHVANRASRAQGRAFLTAVERIFPERGVHAASPSNDRSALKRPEGRAPDAVPFAHFAPVFGACLRELELSRETTARMFFFNHLRSVLAAAVRLNIVGPMEAQMLQQKLSAKAELVRQKCEALTLDQIAQTAPLLDLWQGAQDRLYSRLFQS